MNWFDQANWQFSRLWRQGSEAVEYFFIRLLRSLSRGSSRESTAPNWLEPLLIAIAWFLVAVFAFGLLFLLSRWLWPLIQRWRHRGLKLSDGRQTEIARQGTVSSWLEQAQRLHASSDYAGACRALYMALLIRLDEGGWLRQDLARTDREYLRRIDALWVLAKKPLQLRTSFQQIFLTHEQIEFANRPTSAENYQTCQQAYNDLEPELADKPSL
jgi:Domain of unknown function (DUF4129)